ncbi:MAG TPA: glycosyltransferase, partial [Lachnospiraceae bacterium]|nr:glycosyltransferase [Lachnospiraceae bacterium]
FYSLADVYVNLTLEDTFPTTNIEALACGTPVVTYKAGGSAESIDDTCGIAVERNSVQGVIAAIDKIIALRGRLYTQEHCRKRAEIYDKNIRFLEYVQEVYEGM